MTEPESILEPGPCCFYLKYGECEPPRPPCRYRHEVDDGVTPCCYGATCRLGHSKRVTAGENELEKLEYWRKYNAQHSATVGASPAVRDATLLRSQLEPWSTAALRGRLAKVFGEDHREMDLLPRGEVMRRLLEHYDKVGERNTVRVLGELVDAELCDQLLEQLSAWNQRHKVNTRPSINAQSYMILRSPMEFEQKTGNMARKAAKKLSQYRKLWDLARQAIESVDPEFGEKFSALAVTKGFSGSPHIDKQNTGPFYGLSLGDFADGTGGVCVEADAFTVAHVNTKSRLGKIDGRYPHWVAPYDTSKERYSLIFYSTWQAFRQPGPAYFGEIVDYWQRRCREEGLSAPKTTAR